MDCFLLTLLWHILFPMRCVVWVLIGWFVMFPESLSANLPDRVKLLQEVEFSVEVPGSPSFPCKLQPGLEVRLNQMRGSEIEITFPGRVKLSGIGRDMFQEGLTEPTDSTPGRAVFVHEAVAQLSGPNGERAGTIGLPKGGVVEVIAVRGNTVDIQLPVVQGRLPMTTTDVQARIEAQPKDQPQPEVESVRAEDHAGSEMLAKETSDVSPEAARRVTVMVNSGRRYQTVDGFGTCLITWISELRALYETRPFQEKYVKDLGMNVLRVELPGASLPEPVAKAEAISHTRFTKHEPITETFTEFAKAARRLNPEFKVIATVWSPPIWMKTSNHRGDPALQEGRRSGSISATSYKQTSNYVRKEFYPHFVRWMVEFAKLYKQNGTPLYAISPGNEVMFTQWFQSCAWTAEDLATIVRMLGEALEKEGMRDILIFAPETMTGHNFPGANGDYIKALTQPRVLRYLGAFATHAYLDGVKGDFDMSGNYEFWNMIEKFKKPYWITEGGTGGHNWPQPLKGVSAFFHNNLVYGNASLVTPWQITDVEPNEHGLMVRGDMTKKTRVAQHYTRFLTPGSVRVEVKPAEAGVRVMAAVHPKTQTTTVVVVNPTAEPIELNLLFSGRAPTRFRGWRTSAREDLAEFDPPAMTGSSILLLMPAETIVTLQGT